MEIEKLKLKHFFFKSETFLHFGLHDILHFGLFKSFLFQDLYFKALRM